MTLPANIRVNASVPFPSNVTGSGPVTISKSSGIWAVGLTISQLSPLPTSFDPSTKLLLLYDLVTASFMQTPMTSFNAQALTSVPSFGRNIVGRNGGFEVWQRLVGGATTIAIPAGAQTYGVDGWYVDSVTATTSTWTITQVAGLTNQSRFAARVQRNAAQTGTGLVTFSYPLDTDELNKLKGQTVLLSFTTATGANWSPATLAYSLAVGTGGSPAKRGHTAYTGETLVINGSVNLAANAGAARTVSTLSIAIPAGINQAELFFSWTPTGTAGANDWVTIDDVQVEVVSATNAAQYTNPTFERTDFLWDLERCQRFLPVYNAPSATATDFAAGIVTAATNGRFVYPFQVQPRTPPTGMTVSAAASFSVISGAAAATAASAFTFGSASNVGAYFNVTTAAATVGAGTLQSTAATAQILFTGAEI